MTAIKQSLNRHLSLKLNDFRLLHCSKMLQLTGCINWPMLMVFIVQNKVCHLIILSQYFAYLLAIFLLLAKQHMPMILEACRTSLSVWHVHCDYLAVGWNRQFSGDDAAGHRPRSSSDVERLPRCGGATRRHSHNRTGRHCKTQVWSPP